MALKSHLTYDEAFTQFGACDKWVDGLDNALLQTHFGKPGGLAVVEMLTTNPCNATNYEKVWTTGRFYVLGDKVWTLTKAAIARVSGTRDPKSSAVIPILTDAENGIRPTRKSLATVRLESKDAFPEGSGLREDERIRMGDATLSLIHHQAIFSLEWLMRGDVNRSARCSIKVIDLMAKRPGITDIDSEYQWAIDQILGYYTR